MIEVVSASPISLIPSKGGVIGRVALSVHVDKDDAADPWRVLEGISIASMGMPLVEAPRLMSARVDDGVWCLTVAVLFNADDKTRKLYVVARSKEADSCHSEQGEESSDEGKVVSFPNVLIYDFRAATEHAVSNKYDVWFSQNRATSEELAAQRKTRFADEPTFSIVVPLYRTPLDFLYDVVGSVEAQTYGKWQLILVNASTDDEDLSRAVAACADADKRITVVNMHQNEGIVGNTNAGIAAATGDFVGFMDHDDMLEPNLLFEYAQAINDFPDTDLLYCDEDLFDKLGNYFDPLFKPEFNLDLLRTHNYATHLYTIRKTLLDKLNLPGKEMEGAQDYDLTLKASEQARRIVHVPKVLYHWRAHELSTNVTPESKPYAEEAGRLAIQAHLDRTCPGATVRTGELKNTYVVDYPISGNPKVSIVIPNKDQAYYLKRCVKSVIDKAGWDNLEIIIVENNSTDPSTFSLYDELEASDSRVKIAFWEGEGFNYSSLVNFGAEKSTGDYLLFLNNDTEAFSDGFVRSMLSFAMRPDVGVVGARLLFADETIQHAGVSVQFNNPQIEPAFHLYRDLPRGNGGYHDRAVKTQDYSAVTGACQMTPKAVFNELGGYDEQLAVAFNDVDFCLKARQVGYLVVYDAQAELIHHESVSRGSDSENSQKADRAAKEKALMFDRWAKAYAAGDPYMNPNYDPQSPYCRLVYKRDLKYMEKALRRRLHRFAIKMRG